MSNEPKKESPIPAENAAQSPELSNEDLSKAVGGAIDTFLNIDGIKGESTDDKHKDWIELQS
jgi:type VI protein secretion system component Hcp